MLRRSLPAILIALHLIICVVNFADPVDDAFISYRYSKNLAQGEGLTYNPGERVEGYSNFAWVLLMSAISPDSNLQPVAAQAMGLLFEFLSLLLVYRLSRLVLRDDKWALFALVMFSMDHSSAIWSVSGLETAMYTSLTLAAVYFMVLERPLLASAMALIGALTRPEGPIIFIMIIVSTALIIRRQKRMIMFPEIAAVAVFTIGYGAYLIFKWQYFGGIFPNPYYAKVEGTGPILGTLYVFGHLYFGWGAALILFIPALLHGCMKTSERIIAPVVMLCIHTAFVIAAGGDWMPHGRLFLPVMPIAYILIARGLKRVSLEKRSKKSAIALGVLLVAPMLYNAIKYEVRPSYDKSWHRNQASYYNNVFTWGVKNMNNETLVAIGDIGYFGFYTGTRIIDTMGLVDLHLAKLPGQAAYSSDPGYVLGKNPDYVISMVRIYPGNVELGHNAFDRALMDMGDDKFKNDYGYAKVAILQGFEAEDIALGDLNWTNLLDPPKRTYKVEFRVYAKL